MQMSRQTFLSKALPTRPTCRNNKKKCLGKELWRVLLADKCTDHDKPQFDLFFTAISTSKKMFFQSARWKRHCATHWREQRGTLINNGKLANQIARLAANVIKKKTPRKSLHCMLVLVQYREYQYGLLLMSVTDGMDQLQPGITRFFSQKNRNRFNELNLLPRQARTTSTFSKAREITAVIYKPTPQRNQVWKKRLEWDSNLWPLRYRCSSLPNQRAEFVMYQYITNSFVPA